MTTNLPETKTDTEVLTAEEHEIIQTTITQVSNIIHKHEGNAYYEIGKLLLKNIYNLEYDGDWNAEAIDSNVTKKHLFENLQREIDKKSEVNGELPKKTWFYNSLNLVKDLKEYGDVEGYDQLNTSQKIRLLPVSDREEKTRLISTIASENLSVRDTAILLDKEKKPRLISIISYIKNPEKILDVSSIELVGGKKKEKAIQEANNKIEQMKADIKQQQENQKKVEALLKRLTDYEPKKGRKPTSKPVVH